MIMSDDREAFVSIPEGSRSRLIVPVDAAAQERIKELEGKLEKLLRLWVAQTSTVRVEPGGALLVGGVGHLEHEDFEAMQPAVEALKGATGITRVWLFGDDIDVQAVSADKVRELLDAAPGRPAQAGTDIPVDAAYEDQTMPDSRPNTRTSE